MRVKRTSKKPSVRIQISNAGSLTSKGYSLSKVSSSRKKALGKAVQQYGYGTTMRKVNALYVFNKNNVTQKEKLQSDKNWLRNHYSTVKMGCGMPLDTDRAKMGYRKSPKKSKRSSPKQSRKKSKRKSKARKVRVPAILTLPASFVPPPMSWGKRKSSPKRVSKRKSKKVRSKRSR